MNYIDALKILNEKIEEKYKITELSFDTPDMFIFWYENKEASYGTAFDYFAVNKHTKEVILDSGIILENLDKLSDEELANSKKNISIVSSKIKTA